MNLEFICFLNTHAVRNIRRQGKLYHIEACLSFRHVSFSQCIPQHLQMWNFMMCFMQAAVESLGVFVWLN